MDSDLASPGGSLAITPEDMDFPAGFREDFMAYQSVVRGDQYQIALNTNIMMDPASTSAQVAKSKENLVLGEQNRDALFGDGFEEAFFGMPAPDDDLVTTVPRAPNLGVE